MGTKNPKVVCRITQKIYLTPPQMVYWVRHQPTEKMKKPRKTGEALRSLRTRTASRFLHARRVPAKITMLPGRHFTVGEIAVGFVLCGTSKRGV